MSSEAPQWLLDHYKDEPDKLELDKLRILWVTDRDAVISDSDLEMLDEKFNMENKPMLLYKILKNDEQVNIAFSNDTRINHLRQYFKKMKIKDEANYTVEESEVGVTIEELQSIIAD